MKKSILYTIGLATLFFTSCDSLPEEQFEKYIIMTRNGVQERELAYDATKSTTTNVSISISGSAKIDRDVFVDVELNPDTLAAYNFDQFRYEEGLYYNILPDDCFEIPNKKALIKAGDEYGLLPVNINMEKMNKLKNYVLPLTVVNSSAYNLGKPIYRTILMKIILTNEYSGLYAGSAKIHDATEGTDLPYTKNRTLYTLDEKTCYMFGGNIEEKDKNRDKYIIKIHVNENNTLTLTSDNPGIVLTPSTPSVDKGINNITITEGEISGKMGKEIKMNLNYSYKDLTNAAYPVTRTFTGTFTKQTIYE